MMTAIYCEYWIETSNPSLSRKTSSVTDKGTKSSMSKGVWVRQDEGSLRVGGERNVGIFWAIFGCDQKSCQKALRRCTWGITII